MSSLQKFHRRTNSSLVAAVASNGGDPYFDKVVMQYVPDIAVNGFAFLSPDYGYSKLPMYDGPNSRGIATTYPTPVSAHSLRFIGASGNPNMYATGAVLSGVHSSDFTAEGWFMFNSAAGPNGEVLFMISDSPSNVLMNVGRSPNFFNKLNVYVGGSSVAAEVSGITSGVFFHLAVVRSGTNLKMYIDGVSVMNTTITTSVNPVSTPNLIFGSSQTYGNSYSFVGYMGEFRLTTHARYTSNFTRPSAPFPTWKDNYAKPLSIPTYTGQLNSTSATITATPGTWDVTPTLSYQWQVSVLASASPWVNISGATSLTSPSPVVRGSRYRIVETATYNGVTTTNYGPSRTASWYVG